MKNTKNQEKPVYVDDGHTVYSMEGLESPLHQKKGSAGLTAKERFAAIKAGYAVYLPIMLLIMLGFGLALLLMFLWLN